MPDLRTRAQRFRLIGAINYYKHHFFHAILSPIRIQALAPTVRIPTARLQKFLPQMRAAGLRSVNLSPAAQVMDLGYPSTQYLRFLVPDTMVLMVFGTRDLRCWVDPFGGARLGGWNKVGF